MTAVDNSTRTIALRAGARGARRDRGAEHVPYWLRVVGVFVGLFFVLPTLVVIPMSFSAASTFQFPPKEFSLRLYENFFTNPVWIGSLWNSIVVAVLVAVLATTVGTVAALGLDRLKGRLGNALRTILMVPIVTPTIIIAVAVYVSFLQWRMTGSLLGYVLAHSALALPFVIVCVTGALGGFDSRLLRAAAALGASPWRAFVTVTMPLISRGIITGAVFAFVTSFDEVVIALFIRSPAFQTLPVQMYNSVTVEIDPTIAASSTLIVVFVTAIILAPQLFTSKKKAGQEQS